MSDSISRTNLYPLRGISTAQNYLGDSISYQREQLRAGNEIPANEFVRDDKGNEFKFDEQGRLIQARKIDSEGNTSDLFSVTYFVDYLSEYDTVHKTYEYTVDMDEEDGENVWSRYVEENENGEITDDYRTYQENDEDDAIYRYLYVADYDENGVLSEETVKELYGNYKIGIDKETSRTSVYDADGKEKERITSFNDKTRKIDYYYDENDRLVSEEVDDGIDGTIDAIYKYEYDEMDRVIKETMDRKDNDNKNFLQRLFMKDYQKDKVTTYGYYGNHKYSSKFVANETYTFIDD